VWHRATSVSSVLWQLSLEVLAQVHRAAPRSHLGPLALSVAVLGGLAGASAVWARRSIAAGVLGSLAGAALALAISLTLFRGTFPLHPAGERGRCALTTPALLTPDGVANLALLAPAAFLFVLAVGRPLLVVVGLALTSAVVEAGQSLTSVGVCDTSDALLNTAGAVMAALVAVALRAVVARWSPAVGVSGSSACRRSC
jgi:hypothetical protein